MIKLVHVFHTEQQFEVAGAQNLDHFEICLSLQ